MCGQNKICDYFELLRWNCSSKAFWLLLVYYFCKEEHGFQTKISPLYNLKLEYIANTLSLKFESLTICTGSSKYYQSTGKTRVISKVPCWPNVSWFYANEHAKVLIRRSALCEGRQWSFPISRDWVIISYTSWFFDYWGWRFSCIYLPCKVIFPFFWMNSLYAFDYVTTLMFMFFLLHLLSDFRTIILWQICSKYFSWFVCDSQQLGFQHSWPLAYTDFGAPFISYTYVYASLAGVSSLEFPDGLISSLRVSS